MKSAVNVIKKNRVNFKIEVNGQEADLVIDQNSENLTLGEQELYLESVKSFSKGNFKPKPKYKVVEENTAPQLTINICPVENVLYVNVKEGVSFSSIAKKAKLYWSKKNKRYETPSILSENKLIRETTGKFSLVREDDFFENRMILEEKDKQNSHDNELHLSDQEIENVLEKLKNRDIDPKGFFWKDGCFEIFNADILIGITHPTPSKKYIQLQQLKTTASLRRIATFYNCKTQEELEFRV